MIGTRFMNLVARMIGTFRPQFTPPPLRTSEDDLEDALAPLNRRQKVVGWLWEVRDIQVHQERALGAFGNHGIQTGFTLGVLLGARMALGVWRDLPLHE